MNPYKVDYSKFKGSKKITDQRDLLKLRLMAQLKEVMAGMETQEILSITGLDKSDLSRLRVSSFERFSIDRLIKIFDQLGFQANFSVTKK
ncbi:XRE family transcriptional regulator [Bacteriovorax sp. PP10]|jgi:predicted XRE-type DNA-binding protein|uniref:XRE family transcriptional regulator n=1 Tax=Bacteriovorax antarcticus TaxID=3088717 RepID=A0ABU5VUB5_9BACT|nr:XRE family transcriptional regulator [Bacteriovorax sp. PP10]MEA9356647.1 XRE family transcriptional regulator [Bacteriovorax sp. PP10]